MTFTVEPGVYIDPNRPVVEFALLEYDEDEERLQKYELGAAEARRRREAARAEAEKVVLEIPEEFLGIGVRIEDDVLITEDGHLNLTAALPTEPEAVEALCGEASFLADAPFLTPS